MVKTQLMGLALMVLVLLQPNSAVATRAGDLDVLTRSLGFLVDPPRGMVDLAIVYDSASTASTRDAEALLDFAKARKGSGFTLAPRLIDGRALDSLDSADLVLLAAETGTFHGPVFARAREILIVSLHQECIDLDLCVMWVKSTPDVRIVLNRAAAQSVNARFNTTFRMMVQER